MARVRKRDVVNEEWHYKEIDAGIDPNNPYVCGVCKEENVDISKDSMMVPWGIGRQSDRERKVEVERASCGVCGSFMWVRDRPADR